MHRLGIKLSENSPENLIDFLGSTNSALRSQNKASGLVRRASAVFKKADIYGTKISLSYKKNDRFQSHCGALISLGVLFGVFFYFCVWGIIMVERSQIEVSKNSVQMDISNNNVSFAVG